MKRLLIAISIMFVGTTTFAQVGGPGTVVVGGGGSGGGGVTGLTSCADGTALADNAIMRGDGTDKCQGSTVTVSDSTGNLQWEGTTADAFEGNFTFSDPTADWTWSWNGVGQLLAPTGTASAPSITLGTATVGFYRDSDVGVNYIGFTSSAPSFRFTQANIDFVANGYLSWGNQVNTFAGSSTDTIIQRAAAGIVKFQDAIHLTATTSPPRTCDATAEGDIYTDTSHALCWCDGTTWQKLSGAGTCA